MNLLNKACCLDPRFRSLSFLTVEEKKVVIDSVFDEMLVTNLTISGLKGLCAVHKAIQVRHENVIFYL